MRLETVSHTKRYRTKKFGFRVVHVVSLLRELRLHLSITFESQLSSLCIRFALTSQ